MDGPASRRYSQRMLSQWQLWGAFSVLDHLPERAFVSDVLVYDRLIIPVPVEGEDARWVRRDPERQRIFLNVLKDGNPGRVVEIPWNNDHREVRKSRLAAQLAGRCLDNAARAESGHAGPGNYQGCLKGLRP